MIPVWRITQTMEHVKTLENKLRVEEAYNLTIEAHDGQRRLSGEPFSTHSTEVGLKLAQLKQDEDTVIAGLLHDTLEDTDLTELEIESRFGSEVLLLVRGVTNVEYFYDEANNCTHKNLKRFLRSIQSDVRILVIKLIDRLHNMQTLHHSLHPKKQRRKALETYQIYVPLANYAGLFHIRSELEDLCLYYLEPKIYTYIQQKLRQQHDTDEIDQVMRILETTLKNNQINGQITGRLKNASSIWAKMQKRIVRFDQLSDTIGFRILVDSVDACYRTQKTLSSAWTMVPGSFKDYIRMPKDNHYQSLHCVLYLAPYDHVEVQIRTHTMNDLAENGTAHHALYKKNYRENLNPFLDKILEHALPHSEPANMHTHNRNFGTKQKKIYCFTPQGDVIFLLPNSSCLDFAHKVHSGVALSATHALVNGVFTDLSKQLKSGDEIYIYTSDQKKQENLRNLASGQQAQLKHIKFRNELKQIKLRYDGSIIALMTKLYQCLNVNHFWTIVSNDLSQIKLLYQLIYRLKYQPTIPCKILYQTRENPEEMCLLGLDFPRLRELFWHEGAARILKIAPFTQANQSKKTK